jgi:putative spermidine/putrescine transport system substrate-binding protein
MNTRFASVVVAASCAVALALTGCSSSGGSNSSGQTTSAGGVYSGLSGKTIAYFSAGSTGAFNTSLQNTIMKSFGATTGANVAVQSGQCGITQLAGAEDANNVQFSVIQFCTPSDFKQAESKGLLTKLDTTVVPLDKLKTGSYDDYGFNAFTFAAGLLYNTDKFPAGSKQPTSVLDIYNTKDFPGKRCLGNYPQFDGVLESALLATGVSKSSLYPLNVDRALKELDTIRGNTIFWSTAAQGYQDMLSGQCVMGLFPNGSSYNIIQQNPSAHFGYAFGNAISTSSPVAIPKDAPNTKVGQALLRWFITDAASQTAMASATSYLPAILQSPPAIPASAQAYALTGANLDQVIPEDDAYYAANIDQILKQFNAWLAK